MCDPILIFTGAAVGGAVLSGVQQDKQNEALEYNAQINEKNAAIADLQSKDAINRGAITEYQIRRDTKRFIGDQRVAAAASGVDVNSGSAVDAQADTAGLGELDAITARRNAQMEAWDLKNQANNLRAEAKLNRKGKASPYLAAGSSLLGSTANLAGSYAISQMGSRGTPGGKSNAKNT